MLKKFFFTAIIIFGFFSFSGNYICEAGNNILEIPFKSEDAGLSDSFEREKTDIQMEKRGDGADAIQNGIMKIVDVLTKFMGFFAFIYLFYTGGSLIIKGDGDELTGAKTKILWTIFALLMTFLIEPLVRTVFFGGSGTQKSGEIFSGTGSASDAAKIGVLQIEGFIGYIEKFVVLLALVMMIKSAVGMIFSHDEELKLKEQKNTILWTGIGFIIILLGKIFVYYGIYGNRITGEGTDIGKVVAEISGVMKYLLGFVASIAVAMIIYGGAKMIFSGEENAEEGKAIIKNVVIGSIIISVAYVLVITLVGGKT